MRQEKRLTGRKCYDHLGGRLGAMLFERYLQNGWIVPEQDKSTVYAVTPKGEEAFTGWGSSGRTAKEPSAGKNGKRRDCRFPFIISSYRQMDG